VSAARAGARAPGLRQHVRAMAIGVRPRPSVDRVRGTVVGRPTRAGTSAPLLAAIGAIYFGFAVGDGRPSAIAAQAVSALVCLNIALLGVPQGPELLLGLGFLAHAGWDRHPPRGPRRDPGAHLVAAVRHGRRRGDRRAHPGRLGLRC
jgi:hypothetical protein